MGQEKKETQETNGFVFNQTMLRIKDPIKSVKFYTDILGMNLIKQYENKPGKFTLYFMAYHSEDIFSNSPENPDMGVNRPILELTHNWGTEYNNDFSYHNGNSDPKGFGHIGICVPNVEIACARFEKLGVKFIKKPNEGNMKGLAFIQDPDGYWIEIFSTKTI